MDNRSEYFQARFHKALMFHHYHFALACYIRFVELSHPILQQCRVADVLKTEGFRYQMRIGSLDEEITSKPK